MIDFEWLELLPALDEVFGFIFSNIQSLLLVIIENPLLIVLVVSPLVIGFSVGLLKRIIDRP